MNDCSLLLQNTERLNALKSTELFGTAPEEAFTRLNHLATKLLHAPISIFSLIGKDKQFFKSAFGFEITPENNTVPIDISVCQYSIQGKPIAIEDTLSHPMFSDNPAVKALNIVGYLGIPVVTKDGQAIGAVCVIDHKKRKWTAEEISILEDLTASFISEIELRQAVRLAESEIGQRKEFVSIAGHELKGPIAAVLLQAQLQQKLLELDRLTPEKFGSFLSQIQLQLKNLNRMIDDMSDVSRLESGKLSLQKQTMDIGILAKSTVENFSPLLKDAKLKFEAEEKIIGKWDSVRIEQIVGNLLMNAAKYAPGADISIVVKRTGQVASLTICDQGPGIKAEDQEKVFSKYTRVKNDNSVKGLGLGLYLARQIAEDHGGKLILVPTEIGASFELQLPL